MDPFSPIWSKLHEYYKNMTIFISFDLNLFLGSLRVELLTWHWKWDWSIEITWFVATLFIPWLRLISQKLSPSSTQCYITTVPDLCFCGDNLRDWIRIFISLLLILTTNGLKFNFAKLVQVIDWISFIIHLTSNSSEIWKIFSPQSNQVKADLASLLDY